MWPEQRRFYSNSLLMYFQPSEHSGKWDILPKRVTIHVWKQHHSIPTLIDTIYWNLAAAPWRCVSNTTSIPYYLLQTNLWKYLVAASVVFQYNFQVSKTNPPIPAMFSPSEVPVQETHFHHPGVVWTKPSSPNRSGKHFKGWQVSHVSQIMALVVSDRFRWASERIRVKSTHVQFSDVVSQTNLWKTIDQVGNLLQSRGEHDKEMK